MMAPTTSQKTNPERIFNALNAYQQTATLKTAIELDIFTVIAEGAQEAKTIAERIKASEKGVRVLCDFLTIHGFLDKEGQNYRLTDDAAFFLNKKSPAYLGTIIGFLANDWTHGNFSRLTEIVQNGGSTAADGDNTKPNDAAWVAFAKSMAPMMMPAAQFIAGLLESTAGKPMKVLDIAAGHGMFGITIAKQNPSAHITALDWPSVLEVAKENAQKHGVADRYTTKAGSAFEADLGEGYDYVLLTNIFHHFDMATCEKLMKRVNGALKAGGKAITLEFVPNEDRVSPKTAAGFSLIMLAGTNKGDAYTLAEYQTMFGNAGFAKTTMHPADGSPEMVLVSEK